MAAPSNKDTTNLAGTWNLNRKLSDDPDKIFAIQGVPWVVRQVLRRASLSLKIRQVICLPDGTMADVTDDTCPPASRDGGITTLHIKQTVNPGGFDSEGSYPIDGKPNDYSLPIFGDVMMQLRYLDVADVPDETLREKLSEANPSKIILGEVTQKSSKGWQAHVM